MGKTLVEKIIARASGQASVRPGEIVTCKVDLAMIVDSGGPRKIWPRLTELGVGLWDPNKIVVVSDHFVPAVDAETAAILKLARDFVREFKIPHFYDMKGICHIVLPEHGHLQPGMFVCGGDSHSTMGGAYGCYMAGFGGIEMTGVCITGEIWTRVPETIRVDWSGKFNQAVVAKDVMLFLCRQLGMDNAFKAMEYGGDTVSSMSMSERGVLCNMAAELGCETGVIAPDQTTLAAIRAAGKEPAADALKWCSDDDANYVARHKFSASDLQPQVAAPHAPSNSGPVTDYKNVKIDQAYIGACVGAKLSDLRMAAEVLKGRKVASHVRLLVAPATQKVYADAAADGTLNILTDAGAIMLASGCGACAALGAGVLGDDEVCISSTNRNFKGRMGSNQASVYLGSPYTVAAAATAGHIADPREFLS
ncbi:MAG: 3-isopropylmalate dehydratase large subunit [Rhodospirillaceae bacterium]|nr:3-isopropylmalate dehydratase large subunit [Rhodospirillaceae bacterium]